MFRCYRCNTHYPDPDPHATYPEDMDLCPTCRKRQYVTPYHRFVPKLSFINGTKSEFKDLYFGIELEVGVGGEDDSIAGNIVQMATAPSGEIVAYCSHDSSIYRGFEIISQPCSYEYLIEHKDKIGNIFNYLREHGYNSETNGTCGYHIHFSRAYYADNEELYLTNLCKLVNHYWDEISIFSRRRKADLEHFARPLPRDCNGYYRSSNRRHRHELHYYSVNISNQNTIELRMFKGTINLELFYIILEFTKNLIVTAKTVPLEVATRHRFEDYLDDNGKQYYRAVVEAAKWSE